MYTEASRSSEWSPTLKIETSCKFGAKTLTEGQSLYSTEEKQGCSKIKSPEIRQVQERLVLTLKHMQVPQWDRNRCPEEETSQRRSSVTKSRGAQFFFPKSEKQKKKKSQRRKRNIRQYLHMYGSIKV